MTRAQGWRWLARFGPTVAASAFLLAFYWRGLNCFFYQDDFGWLHIGPVHNFQQLLVMLFAPKAHGNLRPWSENLFFYGLHSLFGMNPLPFRIVVFATVIGDLFLLDALMRRLTGSAAASLTAQLCWLVNPAFAPNLCWTCIYNETQYLFFVLLGLVLFIDGRPWAAAAAFVVGLGSLETMVMYPLIATLYALLYDRKKLLWTPALYAISLAFTAVHFWAAPAVAAGPYAIKVDSRIFQTLGTYIQMVLGPERLGHFHWEWPAWVVPVGTVLMCAAVLVAIALNARAGLLGAGWFLALLGPQLVLPEHILDYLLAGPAMGLAIVLGASVAARWRAGAVLALGYFAIALPAAWAVTTWHYERSLTARNLVLGVVDYDRAHPSKKLLLRGMDTDQFFAGFVNLPFGLYGLNNVYLAPGADHAIEDGGRVAHLFVLPPRDAEAALAAGAAVVLDVSGGQVREASAGLTSGQ
jgi:hypothetical protein